MMDEIGLRKDVDRAAKAEALLASDLFREAFDALRDGYLSAIAETKYEDVATREALYHAIRALENVKAHFTGLVSTGSLARRELSDAGL